MQAIVYSANDKSLNAHLLEAYAYKAYIEQGAKLADVHTSIIFGIGSRESGWGLALIPKGPAGTGDFKERNWKTPFRKGSLPNDKKGFGRGLMQIDYDAHPFARTEEWKDAEKNILYGCEVLKNNLRFMRTQKTFSMSPEEILRASIAGYNTGCGNVMRSLAAGGDVDLKTSHHNYSADVLARATWFSLVGGWSAIGRKEPNV